MIRKAVLLIASLAFVVSFAASAMADNGPESILLKGPAGKKEVNFPHHGHQAKLKCAECHHAKGDDGKQVAYTEGMAIGKCASCHELKNSKDNMHQNCLGCHKEESKKGNKVAPTSCAKGCHAKAKKGLEGC